MLRSGTSTFHWCWGPACQPALIAGTIKPTPVKEVKIRWTASLPYSPVQTSVLQHRRIIKPSRRKTGNITAAAGAMPSHTRQEYRKGTISQRYNNRDPSSVPRRISFFIRGIKNRSWVRAVAPQCLPTENEGSPVAISTTTDNNSRGIHRSQKS